MQETIFVRDLAIVLAVATAAGWLLQRLGLSAVVGYLLAGIAIGPFSPVVKLVSDLNHIQLLAQIGLVFLMFSIGLGLSLARLQRMGLSIIAAVIITSILIFNVCRVFGSIMQWGSFETLFLAGMLMVSSSAIIIKVLDELNITHQRAGQLAIGITVLEDVVSVVMLTLFISLIKVGGNTETSLWSTLGALTAFVIFLVVIAVLLVPRLLKILSREPSAELRIIAVTGVVLLAAVWAVEVGYSMALGAFVLGVVVAGTRYKDEVEKSFEALHNIFGAVFFVAVGMMFNYRLFAEVWWLVIVVTLLTLVARPLACAFGLIGVGHSSKNALKAGLALIPIGEFAFVMIQMGKSANVLPETFYALAIGVSLTTAIIGPLLMRRSDAICDWVEAREPKRFREIVAFYHQWLAELHGRSNASLLWQLCSKRILYTAMQLFFVSAALLFSKPLLGLLIKLLGRDPQASGGLAFLFWIILGIVLLAPIIAIWRNTEALVMIIADGATRHSTRSELLRPPLQAALKAVGGIVLLAWFLLMIPFGLWIFWAFCLVAGVVLFFAPVFWRRLVSLHSRLELDFREKMRAASVVGSTSGLPVSVLERPQEWDLQIDEVTLPFRTEHAGRCIADLGIRQRLGCSIMAIDRQGTLLTNPTATEKLFANDKLLLLGTAEQLAAAEQFLRGSGSSAGLNEFDDITMETLEVAEQNPDLGKSLAELDLVGRFGVQICGIQRGSQRIPVPSSAEQLLAGDKLLLLGTHEKIQNFRAHLHAPLPSLPSTGTSLT